MSMPDGAAGMLECPAEITIGLADDHTLFREGIKEVLSTIPGMRVVAEADTGDSAAALATNFQPDVLILDVEMPGLGAASVIKQVRASSPQTRVIVLSMHDYADLVHNMIDSGAGAYLSKTSMRAELVAAISSVVRHSDNVLLSISRKTFEHLENQRESLRASLLTERELEVIKLTAQALTNTQIGTRLYITEATVKRHLTNIYAKLGAVSRVDAIRKATVANLI